MAGGCVAAEKLYVRWWVRRTGSDSAGDDVDILTNKAEGVVVVGRDVG